MVNESKICSNCGQNKSFDQFTKDKNGTLGLSCWCRECWKQYRKNNYETNKNKQSENARNRRIERVEWLWWLKSDIPCADCGKIYEPFCMDFDHLGDKKQNISRMVLNSAPKEQILNEIAKCELVCILCHTIRTQQRFNEKVKKPLKPHVARNIEIINQAKQISCCVCGIMYPPYNMQFDHINPEEKYKNICMLKSARVETLLTEIAKCQVICSLCHRRKSILEQREGRYL